MSRRNKSEITSKLTGSVVAGVLHRYVDASLYLVGDEPLPAGSSPFARCLIGIDGSPASRNAVCEAGLLLSRVGPDIEKVYLVHVLDQSCYYDEDGVSCMQASESGQKALEEAGNLLIDAGIDQNKITTVIHFGKPGTVLAEEAITCDATLVFIGRRDRSRMAQVFLGSVCTDMIQNCQERTIVLSS
jgi:nucleotide-binding universal stress UspA family protein